MKKEKENKSFWVHVICIAKNTHYSNMIERTRILNYSINFTSLKIRLKI